MKLLLENWREFIAEDYEPITTLRIFDFDETIAHTTSETRITTPNGEKVVLTNQKQFDEYMKKAAAKEGIETFDPVRDLEEIGYKIDLSDFSIVKNPEEIKVITDILRKFAPNSKTYIMTARRGNSIGPIIDYIDDIGIDAGNIRVIATQGESKGDVIANMLAQKIIKSTGKSNIDTIEYFEDSQKNIDDVLLKICNNQKINNIKPDNFTLNIYKVVKISSGYNLQKITC